MFADSTTRFSARVGNYVRFRPGYPAIVAEMLRREFGLVSGSVVADVGSGTGLLSRTFLDAGYDVIGVEPNREMRDAGDSLLAGHARFRSVEGHAEATTLASESVDLVVAGQAFHWFRTDCTRQEWTRILRTQGGAALIWNERLRESPFMREVEMVIDRFARAHDGDGYIREGGRSRIEGFFSPSSFEKTTFPNAQQFDFEGLRGRLFSASYMPREEDDEAEALSGALTELFERYQRNGLVTFEYRTEIYWGRL